MVEVILKEGVEREIVLVADECNESCKELLGGLTLTYDASSSRCILLSMKSPLRSLQCNQEPSSSQPPLPCLS